jgi:peptidoglycan/LPS O-acetylase OafA/YrhL
MVLGLVWDNLGLHLFGLTGPYSGGREFMFMQPYPITNHISTLTWTGNLLFLQGIKCSVYGSNGPLWSLSYEFWYYVIFALGVSALDKGQRTIHKVIYALLACWLLFFVGRSIDEYFIIWLLGALVGLQNTKNLRRITDCRWKRFLAGSFGIIFFSVCMVVERGHFYSLIKQQIFADLALACSIWFLLVVILNTASRLPNRYYSDAAQFTSRFSYTLYLVHAPILVFLAAYLFGAGQRWQPDPKHFMEAGAFGLVVLAYSLLIWRLTEANTEVVRNRINSFCNNIAATRKR